MKKFIVKIALLAIILPMFITCSALFLEAPVLKNDGGTGTLFLSIGGGNNARTILPSADPAFAAYKLEFVSVKTGVKKTFDRTSETISDAITLPQEKWNLTVYAYTDTAQTELAAKGTILNVEIGENPAPYTVMLEAISSGDGKGTFRWDLTLPEDSSGELLIYHYDWQENDENALPLNLSLGEYKLNGGYSPLTETGSVELPVGFYEVIYSFSKDDAQSFQWKEILHIYQNLESVSDEDFTDYFNTKIYTVAFKDNNTTIWDLTVKHGDSVERPDDPSKGSGYDFVNWYANEELTELFDFTNTEIIADTVIYAGWDVLPDWTGGLEGLEEWLRAQDENSATEGLYSVRLVRDGLGSWADLLEIIETGDKYITLDLSDYPLPEKFNPSVEDEDGEAQIVELVLPNDVTEIANGTQEASSFRHFSNLTSFTGEGLTTIGDYAFRGCISLTEISLPNAQYINAYALSDTALSTISLPEALNIGVYAFSECGQLASIDLPKVGTIEDYAFSSTKLGNIALPSVGVIAPFAFSTCINLTTVTLSESINVIGDNAFSACTSLSSFYCNDDTPPTLGTNVFFGTDPSLTIYIPAESLTAYQSAWGNGYTFDDSVVYHTVTFNFDNGNNSTSQSVPDGTTVQKPATSPTKEGYTFEYWSLDGTEYDFTTLVTGNITLVAVWESIPAPETNSLDWGVPTGSNITEAPNNGNYYTILPNSEITLEIISPTNVFKTASFTNGWEIDGFEYKVNDDEFDDEAPTGFIVDQTVNNEQKATLTVKIENIGTDTYQIRLKLKHGETFADSVISPTIKCNTPPAVPTIIAAVPVTGGFDLYWTQDTSDQNKTESMKVFTANTELDSHEKDGNNAWSSTDFSGIGVSTDPYITKIRPVIATTVTDLLTLRVYNEDGQSSNPFTEDPAEKDEDDPLEVYVATDGTFYSGDISLSYDTVFDNVIDRYSHVKVIIKGSIEASTSYSIGDGKTVVIEPQSGMGGGMLIKTGKGSFFSIGNNGRLTIQGTDTDTLTFQGIEDNTSALFTLQGDPILEQYAYFTMNEGWSDTVKVQ
ncbi:MAG: leucine-rich repeat protein [Treponema sp.]|jgi:uncharacterized repeat protein (TIGR02543 family)|nr:leucine-rich repeat protein [Treponema sp.]